MFKSKHVLHFNLSGTFSKSMLCTITYNTTISNMYSNGLVGWVLTSTTSSIELIVAISTTSTFFSSYDRFQRMTCFTTIGIGSC
jgi:hypothetical protein